MKMSVQAEQVVIARPVGEVFAFFSNMENSPSWKRTLKTVKASEGPIAVGTVFHEESKIMGRKRTHESQVTQFDAPGAFSYTNRFDNGMHEHARITFTSVDGGTRMDAVSDVEMDRVPQPLAPLMGWQMRRQVSTMFGNFKRVLEAMPPVS